MKKFPVYLLLLLASCSSHTDKTGNLPSAAVVENGIAYSLDSTSIVRWSASRAGTTYSGLFAAREGNFIVKDQALAGGQFSIDITSLEVVNLSVADGKNKFEAHLRSPDFFDAAKYPTARFEITNVEPATTQDSLQVSGNLTLRDSTKNIRFMARVTISEHSLSAKAGFDIDRSDWGINYKGAGNPGNWIISKKVNIQLDVTATRK